MKNEVCTNTDAQLKPVVPYEALASIYDQVMSHVDYQDWLNFALELLNDYGLPPPYEDPHPRILECGCGTGNFSIRLALLGYSIVAFDKSSAMIKIAETKAQLLLNQPLFKVMEYNELLFTEIYDVVLCLYDSINYIMDIKQVNEFLNLVVRALKPGGLFLFDICTEANSRKHFLNREEEGQGVGYRFKRKMRFDSHLMIQENHFNICLDHQPGVIYSEKHQQRIYRPGEMRKAITAAGFIILEETNGLIRKPPRHDSLRVHFLCRSD